MVAGKDICVIALAQMGSLGVLDTIALMMKLKTSKLLWTHNLLLCLVATVALPAFAQTIKVPPTSRTVFKCKVDGKVVYSDNPCLGAEVLNIQPTRGMNQSTGKEVTGRDLMIEKSHEAFVQAIQPVTGMNQQEFDMARRRVNMSGPQKAE